MNSFFAYISRMKYISRWSLMRNSLNENIQEHSHMTAVIAHALGIIRRDIFGIPCDPEKLATIALYHDCSEIITGDLPTPIKYYNEEIKNAYHEMEDKVARRLLGTLPKELQPGFAQVFCENPQVPGTELVKAADRLSAYIKCIEERRGGNDDFLSAEKQTLARLKASNLPEVDYFIQHFIPAFENTLDDLR